MKNTKEKLLRCRCTKQGALDGGLSWLVVVSSFLQQFIVMGTHNIFGLFYTDLLKEFKKDRATTAWVASLSFGVTFMLGPVATACSAKYGIRIVSFIGAVLFTIGLLLTSFVTSLNYMYLTYSLVVGVGACFSYYSSILILNEYFHKRLVTTNGIALAGAGVGTVALAPLIESLLEILDWRRTLQILSIISSVQVLCSCIQYFVKPPTRPMECDFEDTKSKKNSFIDLSLFKNKAYVVWILVVSLVLFGFYVPYVHLVRHCQDLNIPIKKGAMLVGYLAISQTIGKIFFGRISDHPRVNRLYLYQYCLLVCSISTTLLPLMKTIDTLTAYCWVFGFHDGCFVVLIAVLSGDIAGKNNMSSAFGMMYTFSCISMMLGPPVAGWMYSSTGSYVPAFFMAGGFTTVGVCLLFSIPLLLPTEITQQWKTRSIRKEIMLRSDSSGTTKSWSLSSDATDDKNNGRDSPSTPLSPNQDQGTVPHILLINDSKKTNSIGLLLDKYFSMQHLVSQRDSLICRVYSKENLYGIFPPTSNMDRETDV